MLWLRTENFDGLIDDRFGHSRHLKLSRQVRKFGCLNGRRRHEGTCRGKSVCQADRLGTESSRWRYKDLDVDCLVERCEPVERCRRKPKLPGTSQ